MSTNILFIFEGKNPESQIAANLQKFFVNEKTASYDLDIWKKLISAHLKKMNNIVHHSYEFPKAIVDQLTIFSKQIEKYISVDKTVAVLSAFPVFLHDYYGNKEMKKRID